MGMAGTWLRLDLRRRWRSLVVLALLVALSAGVVLTAVAGARRGDTAFGRLWARTLPATVVVLPNQPGFDWAKVRALPEVSALGLFAVYYGAAVEGMDGVDLGFPPANADALQTVERPVVLAGKMASPGRADEAVVTPHFLTAHHKQVGDLLTLRLSTPAQAAAGIDASETPPAGPRVTVRIVGVIKSPFGLDNVGDSGAVIPTYALLTRYRADIMGGTSNSPTYLNGLIRLAGGEAAIPAFRADLARVTGRSDIDVLDENIWIGDPARTVTGYEAACLLAFGLAALLAALVLVGQSVARYASAAVAELLVLRAVGLTQRQAAASAALAPGLAAAAGATLGVAAAIIASGWMPIGAASLAEPSPGISADWLVLGTGWAAAVLLVLAATAAIAWTALRAGPAALARRSPAVAAGARAGLPVPVIVGARFALEPGRGRAAVPVRPAIAGAVAGVLGVLAALTFSAGISDAVRNPARFGQTWQLETFYGEDGQDFAPAGAASRAAAADRDVTGFLDMRIAGAQAGRVSIESYTYAPVDGKRIPMVLTAGRMPASPGEIALAPTTARELRAVVGATIRLAGGAAARTMTVSGIAFVPSGSHNSYDQGAWLTPAGYDRLFAGAHYAFKFHGAAVALRPGADVTAVARRLDAAVSAATHVPGAEFTPPQSLPVQELADVSVLPLALGGFLALLAAGAVGQALTMAVRRRRRELAVLRTLGLTGRQTRLVVVTQASVLAVIGLALGIPLGLAVGRAVWRLVADFTPLAYYPPLSVWALALIVPVTLLAANLLAIWPGYRAARLRPGRILRGE
ncbi:MAG TPA: FtsX-like permease family protein [Trebonia sp.]|nr:FtsX-like permease family protein [Trebonia sp.]